MKARFITALLSVFLFTNIAANANYGVDDKTMTVYLDPATCGTDSKYCHTLQTENAEFNDPKNYTFELKDGKLAATIPSGDITYGMVMSPYCQSLANFSNNVQPLTNGSILNCGCACPDNYTPLCNKCPAS